MRSTQHVSADGCPDVDCSALHHPPEAPGQLKTANFQFTISLWLEAKQPGFPVKPLLFLVKRHRVAASDELKSVLEREGEV